MCGLFGFVNYGNKLSEKEINELCSSLACESELRGSHATGIAYFHKDKLNISKNAVPAHKVNFKIKERVPVLMGHTRHATQGDASHNQNNHPFSGRTKDKTLFALAHNGVLINDSSLKKRFKLPKTKIVTDSSVAVQLLETKRSLDSESLGFMAEQVRGSFTFTVLDSKQNLYIVKGDSPFALMHFKSIGLYVYASTDEILWRGLASTHLLQEVKKCIKANDNIDIISIPEGKIVTISPDGEMSEAFFDYEDYYGCNWWNYGSYVSGKSKQDDVEEYDDLEYFDNICQVAKYNGLDEDDVQLLFECGYQLHEIEDLLYDPIEFEETVNLLKCDY
jgi:glucosamine 6-phosphate synthetase-like amidotransferase/phosphosugar isomerase protein